MMDNGKFARSFLFTLLAGMIAAAPAAAQVNTNVINSNLGYAVAQDCPTIPPSLELGIPTTATYTAYGQTQTNVVTVQVVNYSPLYIDQIQPAQLTGNAFLPSPLPSSTGTYQGNGYVNAGQNFNPTSPVKSFQVAFDPTAGSGGTAPFSFYTYGTDTSGNMYNYQIYFVIAAQGTTTDYPTIPGALASFVTNLGFAALDGYVTYADPSPSDIAGTGQMITNTWSAMQSLFMSMGQPTIATPRYQAQVVWGQVTFGPNAGSTGQVLTANDATALGSAYQIGEGTMLPTVFSLVQMQTCPPVFALTIQPYWQFEDTYITHNCTANAGCPVPSSAESYNGVRVDYGPNRGVKSLRDAFARSTPNSATVGK